MPNNKIPVEALSAALPATPKRAWSRPSLAARLVARFRATEYDRLLAVGARPQAGSALAAHEARLTSVAEREAVARTLRHALAEVRGERAISTCVPLNIANISAAESLIDAVTLRLHSPRPVSARGMARLRRAITDGSGPFYRCGRGDLSGRLGAALAAL